VELLVVIAIIAILVALLLPAIHEARKAVQRSIVSMFWCPSRPPAKLVDHSPEGTFLAHNSADNPSSDNYVARSDYAINCGVPADTCARRLPAAIEEVLLGKAEFPRTWAEASQRHQQLYTEQVRDLQY